MKKMKLSSKAVLSLVLSAVLFCMPALGFAMNGNYAVSVHAEDTEPESGSEENSTENETEQETESGSEENSTEEDTVSGGDVKESECTCEDKCGAYEYDHNCEVCVKDYKLCAYKKPNVTIQINQPDGWHNDKATVTFTVADVAHTGNFEIAKIQAKVGQNGSWTDVTEDRKLEVSENCTVYVQVTDQKDHTYERSRAIKCFDTTKPKKEVNLLIDCGNSETYHNSIKPYLLDMSKQRRKIDYLILSHIHSDHIGGAIPLLLDNGSADDPKIIEISNVIYNGFLGLNLELYEKKDCTAQEKRIYQGIISQGQAVLGKNITEKQITLNEELCISKLLIQGNYNWNAWNKNELGVVVADSQMKIDIGNQSYIQFISPNREQLRRMNKKWELYVKRIYNRIPNIDNLHIRNAFEAFQYFSE